ncbi:MAG: hypothetical protein COT18_00975 [Elusimicrobia bacterium CG08_land_8_20_14_0_20_59_10]|nr:MAG: hypothetical protein COT18_00975 [Elusimicrobia bacterium CG08_land_8_20_14_0_20_59_10]
MKAAEKIFSSVRRRGQILIPSLLVIPSLMIFIYLLFETAKISREKIRQQFAIDSAAFIQMGDYTNLLNRTAYVNGAFPYRIFKEKYGCGAGGNTFTNTSGSGNTCAYKALYDAFAFPQDDEDSAGSEEPATRDDDDIWNINFKRGPDSAGHDPRRDYYKKNPDSQVDIALYTLITSEQGAALDLGWDTASGIYQFYANVYGLLGAVEESQYTVFERLTVSFSFFRKSYYLNASTQECTNNPAGCGQQGLSGSNSFFAKKILRDNNFLMHYIEKIEFHSKVYTGGFPSPYYLGRSNPPMDMTVTAPNGLFQIATVKKDILKDLGNGLDIYQGWTAPRNYFNVDFNRIAACRETGKPCVHAKIATQCPKLTDSQNPNNCVWPDPTPKYQTRLYP